MWKIGETAEWIVCPSDSKHFYQKLLPAIYQFPSLSNMESVILSAAIPVHALEKHEVILRRNMK